jgi:hypothetical protein
MCFSATASFVTAGLTGTIGIVSLTRIHTRREIPLATVPLFFAIQQSIEGALWLALPADPHDPTVSGLALAFLLLADVVWPIYAPFTVWLIEPSASRRRPMLVCIVIGVGVSAWLLWRLLTHSYGASILGNHIDYVTEGRHSDVLGLAYLTATCLPMVLSTRRTLIVLAAIVLVGSITADIFYWREFTSVWCFFAAAASVVILGHFQHRRRGRLRLARVTTKV